MRKPKRNWALNQEHSYQELNGLTDWFSSAVDYASDKVADAALWATEATGTTSSALALTDKIDDVAGQLSASFKNKIKEFQTAMSDLFDTQNKVDEAIESLPDGDEKTRLEAKRDESRGKFTSFILPTWNKFQAWVQGQDSFSGSYSGMGFLVTGTMVATAGAVVTAISIALPYIYANYQLEKQILADPALAKTYVATRGSLLSLGSLPKYAILGVGGILGLYVLSSSGILSKKA